MYRVIFLLSLLILSCSPRSDGPENGSGCDTSLTYAGPTEAGTFSGLDEDQTQCEASSWREIYETVTIPSGSLFVSSSCDSQNADGSLDAPYCSLSQGLAEIAQRDFSDDDTTVLLHVDPGEYTLGETLETQSLRAAIMGLCSETTTLQPASDDTALLTLASDTGQLKIEGVTLSGETTSFLNVREGTLTLANVRVERGGDNYCFLLSGNAALLTAELVDVDGNTTVAMEFADQTESDVSDATLGMPYPVDDTPVCVRVSDGARLEMKDFTIHDSDGVAVVVEDAGSSATLENGVIEHITPTAVQGSYGYGVAVHQSASATLTDMTLVETHGAGVLVDGEESTLTVTGSHISGTKTNTYGGSGVGILVQGGATATVTETEVEDGKGAGIFVGGSSTATIQGSQVRGNAFNVVVANATIDLSESIISEAVSHPAHGGPVSILIETLMDDSSVTATLTGNLIRDNDDATGVFVNQYADGFMTVTMDKNNFVDNGGGLQWTVTMTGFRFGLTEGVSLSQNCFEADGASAVRLHAALATLTQNTYVGTPRFGVEQQCGPTIPPVDISTESTPLGVAHCVCGVRSDTGTNCGSTPVGDTVYDFGIGEVQVIE